MISSTCDRMKRPVAGVTWHGASIFKELGGGLTCWRAWRGRRRVRKRRHILSGTTLSAKYGPYHWGGRRGAGEADLSHRFRGSRIWRSLSSAGGHMEMCRTFCIRMFAVKSEPIIDGTSGTCLFTSFFSFWLLLSGLQGCCAAADGGSRGMNAWLVRKASHSESRSARTLGSFAFFFFCVAALCEGNFTCKENEVCVRPNECRCRHGYFGASCDTSEHHFSSVFSKYFISILAIND